MKQIQPITRHNNLELYNYEWKETPIEDKIDYLSDKINLLIENWNELIDFLKKKYEN